MPLGTTIQFSIDGGSGASLSGLTTWTVKSTTAPTGFYSATIAADAVDPADPLPAPMPRLLLTVTAPDGTPTEFSWPINIIR